MLTASGEDMKLAGNITFHEEQRPWPGFVVIVIVCCSPVVAIFVYGMVEQLACHRPLGDNPMSDGVLAILGPAVIILTLAALIAVCMARLIIEVRPDGLYVRFVPLHLRPKRIALNEVTTVKAIVYQPILQYGGWGIRWTTQGKAYNARGSRGVRLDYANGRHLLLGSQRPDDLAQMIELLRQRETES